MKKEESPFVTVISSVLAFVFETALTFFTVVFSPVIFAFIIYSIDRSTNTTMHQPEPTEQYADSLVCPD